MTTYFLRYPSDTATVDFLNTTDIPFSIYNAVLNDSGWRDYSTGARILSENDIIVFYNITEEQKLFLTLRFGGRIGPTPD